LFDLEQDYPFQYYPLLHLLDPLDTQAVPDQEFPLLHLEVVERGEHDCPFQYCPAVHLFAPTGYFKQEAEAELK
jgi:hypothetical protein